MSTNMADVNSAVPIYNYKKIHEDFVSGHNGTTTWEIALIASSSAVSVLLRNILFGIAYAYKPKIPQSWILGVDFCCLILPLFGCLTVLSDYISTLLLSMLTFTTVLIVVHGYSNRATTSVIQEKHVFNYILDLAVVGKKPFITNFRAYANIATAICILAVDFVIFPRRFCKSETYGTGVMDIAVGGFVIANAIVSPEARGKYPSRRTMGQRLQAVVKEMKSTLPLWVLGLCRLAAVKGVDYQEHVSEYGVHWNFFFTLALVRVLSSLVLCIFDPSLSWLIAIAIASGYEYLLSGLGLRHYILHGADGLDSRSGLIEANREGIFSSLGYCAVFFAGVQLGTFLWQPRSKLREWVTCLLVLVLADVALWVLLSYTESHVTPVSRRLANLPYCLWTMAYSLHLLSAFLLVDILCIVLQETGMVNAVLHGQGAVSRQRTNHCLLEATNRNGLFYFLVANLLTGGVNMTMMTVKAAPTTGFVVVALYMFGLSVLASFLHYKNISLKFW